MFYLATLPLWLSGLLLVGLTTALATLAPGFVRRSVPLERLTTNNEVAGFKFAVVGVVYAVLIAFAVIVVWESSATRRVRWCRRPAPPPRFTVWPTASARKAAP